MKRRLISFIRQAMSLLCSVLLLTAMAFAISRLAPGDPLVSYYGDRAEKLSPQARAWAEEKLGLHDPLPRQYIKWLGRALRGDFGISYKYKVPALEVVAARAGNTLLLGGTGFVLIFGLSLLLGALCARFEDRPLDRFICKAGTIAGCIPEFWLSLVLILVFSVWLKWLPSAGAYTTGGPGGLWDRFSHLVLPLTVVVASHLWYYSYMVRNLLSEETRAGYVPMARAKGLTKSEVLWRHCLPNALPAYLSLMGISLPHILGGTYIVETVFSYPGLGALSYESARYQDYNLLMLLCVLTGVLVILGSMLAQAASVRLDPRTAPQTGKEARVHEPSPKT